MLTIGIPTYNYQIDSLVANIWEQCEALNIVYEIIVVDDASPNAEIITNNEKAMERSNCSYIQHTSNKGRTAARARIAEESSYDWLLFFDADVLPKEQTLIKQYLDMIQTETDAVFGGLEYETQSPPTQEMLRWKYGRAREQVDAQQRRKTPYVSVVSACFLIDKFVFLQTNPKEQQAYGLDIQFAQNLAARKANIFHIDAPVIHLGLETNEQFLSKTKNGVTTLANLTKEEKIPKNYKALQRFYLKIKRLGLLRGFLFFMDRRMSSIKKNLSSSSPSLFWFDMYRVYEYAKEMNNA